LNLLATLFGRVDISAPAEGSEEVKIVIQNREPMEYVIVRGSETPEPVYTVLDDSMAPMFNVLVSRVSWKTQVP
jgi:hypothetical protein